MFIKDYFDKVFGRFEEDFFNEIPELDGEEDYSYYHKVEDRYDNDEHTHTEKEVKNGKVLKDVKKTYKLGKKEEETKQITADSEDAKKKDVEIEKLNAAIAKLTDENKELEDKLKRIEELIK